MRIFTTLMATLLVTLSATAGNAELKKVAHTGTAEATSVQATAEDNTVEMVKVVGAYFQRDDTMGGVSNYYIVLSDKENATYDPTTGTIKAQKANVLFLDLYSQKTATAVLASDEFTPFESILESGMYIPDNTFVQFYNIAGDAGTPEENDFITGNVSVTLLDEDNNYHIEATALNGNTYVFDGHINFLDSNSSNYYWPQIQSDLDLTFTGGMAFYNGNTYESNTGNMAINLFTCDFDGETGAMNDLGYNLTLFSFGKLFKNSAAAEITPGTYSVATNMGVDTYYPGIEMTYQDMTVPFGTYVKQRRSMDGSDDDYAFTYINNGHFTVTKNDDGTYNFDIDFHTSDGFLVKGTASNIDISIIDQAPAESYVSNLEEDVDLNLDYIKTARIYTNNRDSVDGHGYKRFLLDIGSPSGKDGAEGDIFRMEMLTELNMVSPPTGVYYVMEYDHNYYNLFAPYKLIQGYFYNGGLDGTRYEHFEEGRTNVMDLLAPAVEGFVSFEQVEGTDNYHFVIQVVDDAGFEIRGEWTGPIAGYTPVAVEDVFKDKELEVSYLDNNNILLNNIKENDLVNIYSADGHLVFSQTGANQINLNGLANGLYILKVENYTSVKIIKK